MYFWFYFGKRELEKRQSKTNQAKILLRCIWRQNRQKSDRWYRARLGKPSKNKRENICVRPILFMSLEDKRTNLFPRILFMSLENKRNYLFRRILLMSYDVT